VANKKTLALTRDEQVEEFEEAEEMVREDFNESLTYGDVVKHLSQAYTGNLDDVPDVEC
jgi:hypothetical protein